MYRVLEKEFLNPTVLRLVIEAPLVARKAKPGQFIILRVDENGERIPLTIAGVNKSTGGVEIIAQIVGASTLLLSKKEVGESIHDFVGPLGNPTEVEGKKKVAVIGGGVGVAIALPVARAYKEAGAEVTAIIGFRNKDLVILEDQFKTASSSYILVSDDGSVGEKGNVTVPLKRLLESGERFDEIFAVGPMVMMKFVTLTAKPFDVPVTVSMNTIMIDGTGMCGGCRLSVNKDGKKQMRFACVDGPDFNGYEVDFDEAMSRNRIYAEQERKAYEETCNLFKKEIK